MNTKKQYTAPTSEVVDVEVQLMNAMSIQGEQSAPQWTEDTAGDNDDFI